MYVPMVLPSLSSECFFITIHPTPLLYYPLTCIVKVQERAMVEYELMSLDSQIINSLYQLSQSTSFGALPLPLPLSLSHPSSDPTNPSDPSSSSSTVPSNNNDGISSEDLTKWCETRAALEFSRREGMKGGSKAILDILGGQAQTQTQAQTSINTQSTQGTQGR